MDEILCHGPGPQDRAPGEDQTPEALSALRARARRLWQRLRGYRPPLFILLACALILGASAVASVACRAQEPAPPAAPAALERTASDDPHAGAVVKSHVLAVGGETLGSTQDLFGLTALLASLKAPYVTDHTLEADFTVPVTVEETADPDETVTLAQLEQVLTSNSVEEATYTVSAGDTYSQIALDHDMRLQELMDMNPQASLDSLFPGDVLTVRESVPYLSVRTLDQVTGPEPIEPPVEYVEDSSMYKGDSKVLEEGAPGTQLVHALVTSVNGVEESREVLAARVLTPAETRVVARGTKPRPKTMPTGRFIWPVRGTITSRYGYRSIFGSRSFHGGLDIAVPYGTSVKAADGGTVKVAGWHNSYGNYVVIDHGNGKTTYYAHNSKLLVKAGQKVYQGQVIAKAGSTGNSTGPHCHFEVRLGGQRQNPRNYLP